MANPTQVPSILTVIEDGTEYIIRAVSERGKQLARTVTTLLPEATKITLVTDTDVKVFKNEINKVPPLKKPVLVISQSEESPDSQEEDIEEISAASPIPASKRIIQDLNAPPSAELVEEDYEAELRRQEAEAANIQKIEKLNKQSAIPSQTEELPEEAPRVRKKQNIPAVSGSECGRCGGAGVLLAGDVEVPCNVCKGKGTVQAWGRQRGRGGSFKDKAR